MYLFDFQSWLNNASSVTVLLIITLIVLALSFVFGRIVIVESGKLKIYSIPKGWNQAKQSTDWKLTFSPFYFFLFLTFLTFVSPILSSKLCTFKQTFQENGIVKDAKTGKVLGGVDIYIDGEKSTKSDSLGNFSLPIQSSIPKFNFIGCSSCESSDKVELKIFHQGIVCTYDIPRPFSDAVGDGISEYIFPDSKNAKCETLNEKK